MIWIDIQDAAGVKYGDGPIITVQSWDTTARLDKAGQFSFKMPLSDPRAKLVQHKREAWCYAVENGIKKCVGAGIIDKIEVDTTALTLTVSGNDLLRQLNNSTVGYLEIAVRDEDGGYASPDALALIMDSAPAGWSLDTVNGYSATEESLYASFAGQSVLNALTTIAEHSGEHFRLGSGKKLVWIRKDLPASGVRAIQNNGDQAIESNRDVCLITSLTQSSDSYDLVSRIFPFGAGNAHARTSLIDATITPHDGYVIDKSHQKGANLTSSAAFVTYGAIERMMSWKEISPASNSNADIESASNALYGAAYQYLSKFNEIQASYTLTVTKLHKAVYPGQKVRVIFRRVVDDYTVIDLDRDLTVLESTLKYDDSGVQTVAMQVSTIDAWPVSFEDMIVEQMEETRLLDAQPQTYAGYYTEGFGTLNIAPTHSGITRFKFDDRMTRLISCQLRFSSDSFETTATSAQTQETTITAGTNNQSTEEKTTKEKSYISTPLRVIGDMGNRGLPVYFDGTIFTTNGISGSPIMQSDPHDHKFTAPGHPHTFTLPAHGHPLKYEIKRNNEYPDGLKILIDGVDKTYDLSLAAKGVGSAQLNRSDGWTGLMEFEIADILNTNFRREHTVEITCASGQGRLLNVSLRCFVIVQAILVLPTTPVGDPEDPGTPAEPVVNVVASKDGWRVTWLPVTNAQSYRLHGNTVGSDTGATEITLTTDRTVIVPFSAGFSYFAASAIAGIHESGIGPWDTDDTDPTAPTWTSHVYQTTGDFLTWYYPDQAVVKNFVLYSNSTPAINGSETLISDSMEGTVLSYLAPYVGNGPYFGIKVINYANRSSSVVWYGPFDPTPATPVDVTVDMSEAGGGFIVKWPVVANAVRYNVRGATDVAGANALTVWSGNALGTPTIKNGSRAFFSVQAVGIDGSLSGWSDWETDTSPPAQPLINVDRGTDSVVITLGSSDTSRASIGFSHYILERADDSAGTNNKTILSSWVIDANIPYVATQPANTIRYYRFIAVDVAGNLSLPSPWMLGSTVSRNDTVQDWFDGYGGDTANDLEGLNYLRLVTFDDETQWQYYRYSTSILRIESGSRALVGNKYLYYSSSTNQYASNAMCTFPAPIDLSLNSRFLSSDQVRMSIFATGPSPSFLIGVGFWFVSGYAYLSQSFSGAGYHTFSRSRSDQDGHSGTVDWSSVLGVQFNISNGGTPVELVIDDLRLTKVFGEWSYPNDTANLWKVYIGALNEYLIKKGDWRVFPGNRTGEPNKPFSYGHVEYTSSPSRWNLSYRPLETTLIFTGTVQVGIFLKELNGKAGIAFYIQNVEAWPDENWTMYAVELDTAADTVTLVKWIAGTRTALGSAAFTCAPNQIVWLGADFRDFMSSDDTGRIKVFASLSEGVIISAENLKISLNDTSLSAGGSVGLLSYQANCRFVNFTAGSPAHAEVADIAKALDGPMIDGRDGSNRVYLAVADGALQYSQDKTAWLEVTGEGGGVTDHGLLTGLADDDHVQYHNDARGDTRYTPISHLANTSNPHGVTAAQVGLGNVSNTAQVTAVTGTAPIVSSGGLTPAISIDLSKIVTGDGTQKSTQVANLNTITASGFYRAGPGTNGPDAGQYYHVTHQEYDGNWAMQLAYLLWGVETMYFRTRSPGSTWSAWQKIWNEGNDGSGSGLDADTVDGIHGSQFVRNDAVNGYVHFNALRVGDVLPGLAITHYTLNGHTYIRFRSEVNGIWQSPYSEMTLGSDGTLSLNGGTVFSGYFNTNCNTITAPNYVYTNNGADNYIRKSTPLALAAQMGDIAATEFSGFPPPLRIWLLTNTNTLQGSYDNIATAIAAVNFNDSMEGGRVLLGAGEFVTTTVLYIYRSITITGMGQQTKISTTVAPQLFYIPTRNAGIAVTLESMFLSLTAGGAWYTCVNLVNTGSYRAYLTIKDCAILAYGFYTNSDFRCMWLEGNATVTLIGCSITNSGAQVSFEESITLKNNLARDSNLELKLRMSGCSFSRADNYRKGIRCWDGAALPHQIQILDNSNDERFFRVNKNTEYQIVANTWDYPDSWTELKSDSYQPAINTPYILCPEDGYYEIGFMAATKSGEDSRVQWEIRIVPVDGRGVVPYSAFGEENGANTESIRIQKSARFYLRENDQIWIRFYNRTATKSMAYTYLFVTKLNSTRGMHEI